MRKLFPGAPPDRLEWEPCRRAVVKLWDTLTLGGARTADEVDDARPAAGDRLPVEAI